MKFIVYFEYRWSRTEDQLVVEGETIEEIQDTVNHELERRGAEYLYSESYHE